MKIKTSELSGNALDWAVAKCGGVEPVAIKRKHGPGYTLYPFRLATLPLEYSTKWAQGGPIIEREHISTNWLGTHWQANVGFDPESGESDADEAGHTALIAAMRCYVASKLGEEVEIPDSIISNLN